MGNSSDEGKPRDDRNRFEPETSVQEVLDIFEEHGEKRIKTTELADEMDYTRQGITKRLRRLDEYVEEEDFGQGSSSLWSLKYTRDDFIEAMDELDDLTRTEQIADYVGCSEEVAREWMFKLEDEDVFLSMPRGDEGLIWSKEPG
jgi:predicted ArsR family transcriptional regulator